MRIVVTGGAGFIGSHLCEALVGAGHTVVAVDNLLTGRAENLASLASEPRFSLEEADVIERLQISGGLDAVLHLASPASPDAYAAYPIETLRVGSEGTRHALELASARGARFLLASTSEVYGDPDVHPQPETYAGNVNPVGPRAVYDEAKRYAEALTAAYQRLGRADTRIVRIFNTYGPRMRLDDGRVIPTFAAAALRGEPIPIYGKGSQTRSFCHVDDMVRGLMLALAADHAGPINLGNPEEMTIAQLATLCVATYGDGRAHLVYQPLPVDDPRRRCPDLTVARAALGFEPTIDLATGLRRCEPYFREAVARSVSPARMG
ncbi:MAG: NAD-dependent epimerase/dehydratase family protein [Myxococcota bacterium]